MPTSVLTRGRKIVARLTALAMVASIMVIGALPASAAIDTSATCPASTPSAGFTDIAGLPASTQLAINCIADYEISQGTSATTFSPAMEVSRWQMALFLTRQAEVHGLTLGDGSDQGFTDIGAYPAATQVAINQLAQLDITQGTTATTFSPAAPVSRWQMALFLTRLLTKAGVTLGDGSDQGFTDISAYPASTQVAINQIAQAEVSEGFSATTFGPGQPTLRSQMALFLTRTLAADGIVPAGSGFIVTAFSGIDFSYSNGTAEIDVDAKTTDTFYVDGAKATSAVFAANLSVGDRVAVSGTEYRLTNVAASSYVSGVIDVVDTAGDDYAIIEPVTGTVLNTVDYDGAYTLYTVDGAAASLSVFESSLQAGDMVTATGTGADAANIRTIALTNMTASGKITALVAGTSVTIAPFADALAVADGDKLSVDGSAVATAALYIPAGSEGDLATYSKVGGVVTATRTNQAKAAVTGTATGVNVDDVSFELSVAGASSVIAFADVDVLSIDGVLATVDEFEAALSPFDTVEYQAKDGVVIKTSVANLKNVSGVTGAEVVAVNALGTDITVEVDGDTTNDGPDSIAIASTGADVLGLDGDGGVVYQINGVASASAAAWATDVQAFITSAAITPKLTVSVNASNDLVFNVTS